MLTNTVQQRSVIDLPALRAGRPQNSRTLIPNTPQGDAAEPLQVTLSEIQPIRIRRVELPAEHRLWRELVGRHHYLGYRTAYGTIRDRNRLQTTRDTGVLTVFLSRLENARP